MNRYYDSLRLRDQERFLLQKEDIAVKGLGELTPTLLEEITTLEPFGMGNPEPVFLAKNVLVTNVRLMGAMQQHVRVVISSGGDEIFQLVAFYAPDEWKTLQNV